MTELERLVNLGRHYGILQVFMDRLGPGSNATESLIRYWKSILFCFVKLKSDIMAIDVSPLCSA
jgi:hypothetical protein